MLNSVYKLTAQGMQKDRLYVEKAKRGEYKSGNWVSDSE